MFHENKFGWTDFNMSQISWKNIKFCHIKILIKSGLSKFNTVFDLKIENKE